MNMDRRSFIASAGALGALAAPALWTGTAAAQQPAGAPIRVGGTLALTGPLSATGLVH